LGAGLLVSDSKQVTKTGKSMEKTKRGRKPGAPLFPRNSLNESLKVSEVIWNINAGNPFPLFDIAKKIGHSPTSSSFRKIIRSSQRYGLTNESFSQELTKTISLTALGKSIVAPTPEENINVLKRNALMTPNTFSDVLTQLNGKIIPPADVFMNMLIRTYNLVKSDATACYVTLMKNIEELGLSDDFQGKVYLRIDKLGTPAKAPTVPISEEESSILVPPEEVLKEKPTPLDVQKKVPIVFISHSKNKTIVNQIKQMLSFGNFNFEIAEERETTAIPLSDKIFQLMRKCNCAIINISADEEKRKDETYGINENVLIEIGGSFLHYKKRVILVIDKRLKDILPSILKGLTAIFYEGNELSWSAGMRLQKALTEFRESL